MGQKELGSLRKKHRAVCDLLDERARRGWAAAEARSLPYGGVPLVARATGRSRTTIHTGMRELKDGPQKTIGAGRGRKAGGGRKSLTYHKPELLQAFGKLVEPTTRGDPESPLRWTCKSTRHLAGELRRQGYGIGDRKVADLLHRMQYSLQANAKTIEGSDHPGSQCPVGIQQ